MFENLEKQYRHGLSLKIFQELILRYEYWKCKNDPVYFIMTYCYTHDPHDRHNPFKLLPDKEYIKDLH